MRCAPHNEPMKLIAIAMLGAAGLWGCASGPAPPPSAAAPSTLPSTPSTSYAQGVRYRCDDQTEFTLQWSEDSVVLDAGPRGREVLLRDAGGLTPQQTVYTNANLRAEFGLGASGREAILRYLSARQVANCVKD